VPGSIASATLSALAATAIIWIAAFSQLGVSNGSNSDLVAVLLAVPAVMGAWSGFDRGSGLFGGTLVARICSILTIVVSLLAAIYFILGPKDGETETAAILTRPGAVVWMCLGSATTLILLSAILSWSMRSLVQARFVEEGVE
jgi:hypothetical protein